MKTTLILTLLALALLVPPASADMRSERRARAERRLSPVQQRELERRAASRLVAQRAIDRLHRRCHRPTKRLVIIKRARASGKRKAAEKAKR